MQTHLSLTIAVLTALSGVLWLLAPAYRARMQANALLLGIALALELSPQHPFWVTDLAAAFAEVAAIRVAAIVIFRIVLHRTGWPVILTDVAIVGGYAVALVNLLVEVGVNVSGLIATSALLAGIVGLALQEVLGNLIGGAAIHADGAIREGVWIKTEHGIGRVTNVRLRHTSIETADNNSIIIPNSSLTKGAVTIISNRQRLILRFQLPASHRPTTVIRMVEEALSSPLNDVAREPAPRCFIAEFQAQHIEYAVHVWVTSPGREEVPTSLVLARVFFVLARAGAPVGSVLNSVELHNASAGADRQSRDSAFGLLKHIPIWSLLTEGEMSILASRLKWLVHGPGETIVRQGDEGSSMFVLLRGAVAVSLRDAHGRSEQVATLSGGDFFGEMSLMTGEKRSASVTALEEVECAELHKDDVAELLLQRPELAREISAILEQRQGGLASARERFQSPPQAAKPLDLLGRIQQYFSIDRIDHGFSVADEPPPS
jgi:CRP-like cAMP-binding protein/small-conductance mechanosensitive channel